MCLATLLSERVHSALDQFQIELPRWFANTGTRFGKFQQAAAANTLTKIERRRHGARSPDLPYCRPARLVDLPNGAGIECAAAARYGVLAGSISPNVFQIDLRHGSLGNPIRRPPPLSITS
jgi:L-rhamnose isomerase/sugar isomerase